MAKLLEGKKAPSFEYTNLRGKKISLNDFLGSKVLIYFYPRDNTPGCTKQACSLRAVSYTHLTLPTSDLV